VPDITSEQQNNRRANRKKALLPGIITAFDGSSYFDCALKDVSLSGARISFPGSAKFPVDFLLINMRDRAAHHCSLAWKKETSAGVMFQSTVSLGSGLDRKLHFLRRLWLERAVR
jgi:hypothetical protein